MKLCSISDELILPVSNNVCVTNLPSEAKRTSGFKKERGDKRSKEYSEVIKEPTQNGK